jgi:hypothetical protein
MFLDITERNSPKYFMHQKFTFHSLFLVFLYQTKFNSETLLGIIQSIVKLFPIQCRRHTCGQQFVVFLTNMLISQVSVWLLHMSVVDPCNCIHTLQAKLSNKKNCLGSKVEYKLTSAFESSMIFPAACCVPPLDPC